MQDSRALELLLEFKTSNMTLHDFCSAREVNQDELLRHKLWVNHRPKEHKETQTDIIIEPEVITTTDEPETRTNTAISLLKTSSTDEDDGLQTMRDDILEFKKIIVSKAKEFSERINQYTEVKEMKEMVSLVDIIDKSITHKATTPLEGANVYIQNIINNFKDDC